MEFLENYIRQRLRDGDTIDGLCDEFTTLINKVNNDYYQTHIMEPLLESIDEYYQAKNPETYEKIFPNGISQESVETILDSVLEMGGALKELEVIVEKNNLNPQEIATKIVNRLFA